VPLIVGPLPSVIYPKPTEQPKPQLSVEQQDSQRFWTAQGYPQYAGRYKAVDLQGRQIESVAETPEGLKITFKVQEQPVLPRTRGIQSVMQSVLARSGSYLAALPPTTEAPQAKEPSDWQKRGIAPSYPESRFIHSDTAPSSLGPEPETYKSWIPQGRPESRYLIRNEPPTIADVTLVKTPPSVRVEVLNRIFQEQLGKPLGVQGAVSFEEMSKRLVGIQESLVIQEYHQKGYELVGRTETELLFQPAEKNVFVSTSLFGPKMLWVSETTGEHFEQVTPTLRVKLEQGLTPSPHELSAMTGLSLVSAAALPIAIPKLAVFATVGMGVGEAVKYGTTGEYLTVEEIINAASVGELVGLFAMNVTMPKIIKSPFEKVGGEVTYQFHQHAPEWLLKVAYGKEMGVAITVERQWAWGKPVAEGTAGLLEETFGMPFYRAETLHYAMPVLEWQRVTYMEWLAPRVAIESQWGWSKAVVGGTAGLLEESFGMPFYRAESLHYSMPTLEWQRVKFTEWIAPRVRVESQWGWESEALGLKGGEPALTAMVKPEAFRAAESLHMAVATIRQPERWYLRTSGFTRTPMEVTLQRATEDKIFGALSHGGLSATQELDVIKGITAPSPETFLTAPTRLYAGRDISEIFAETTLSRPYAQRGISEAFMGVEQLVYAPRTSLVPFGLSLLGFMLKGESIQKTKLIQLAIPTSLLRTSQVALQAQTPLQIQSQVSLQVQIPLQAQSQKQMLKQMQLQVQLLKTMQIQAQTLKTTAFKTPTIQQFKTPTFKVPTIPKSFGFPTEQPTRGKGKKRVTKKRGQGVYLWEFPILDPEKVWKLK